MRIDAQGSRKRLAGTCHGEDGWRVELMTAAVMADELALAWSDGQENFIKLRALREACPCAGCQGEPDALGRVVKPEVSRGVKAYELLSWDVIGGYALQFRWADGHSTGLYTYQLLRSL